MSYVDSILERVQTQNPNEPEFNQAVKEVLESLRPVIERARKRKERTQEESKKGKALKEGAR